MASLCRHTSALVRVTSLILRLIAVTMDKVAVATLNATVLAIYEAVIVILVARARSMREPLDRLVAAAKEIADRAEVRTLAVCSHRAMLERPVVRFIPAGGQERERLLEMLLSRDDVVRQAQEEAHVKDVVREWKLLDKLEEAKASDVVTAREELKALSSDRSLDEPPEVPEVPEAAADQGVLLAALLAGFLCEPIGPKPLSDESAIDRWLDNADRVRRIRRLLDQNRDAANELINAAVAQQDTVFIPKSLLPGVAAILREQVRSEAQLAARLRVYRRDRPAPWSLVLLGTGVVVAVIGGAVVFVVGVITPILWTGCPKLLYAWIPAAWYTVVLVTLCVNVTRTVVQLGSRA